jgi:hypothetical protein
MLDAYIAQSEAKLAQLNEGNTKEKTPGEEFANGFGRAIYVAMLDFLKDHRARLETEPQAAVAAAE